MLFAISHGLLAKADIAIENYRPTKFIERAESPFFYSIGKRLKFGSSIDASAPALFEGAWLNGDIVTAYASPDNQKIAIVSNRKLYIARVGRPPLLVLENVDHYGAKQVNDSEVFFKWPTLQWHPNSRFIYIAKDKKKKGETTRFSKDAILVRIDIENVSAIEEVVSDFRSSNYFFSGSDSVCFNYAAGDGSLTWRCWTPKGISAVLSLDSAGIHLKNGSVLSGRRFLTYAPDSYESDIWMAHYGFSVRAISDRQDALFHTEAPTVPLLILKAGTNIKGTRLNGIYQRGGSVLPGGRYLLLNMVGGASKGQILLDRVSGHYRKLPKNTRIYRNLNSTHYDNFIFSIDKLAGNRFKPSHPTSTQPYAPVDAPPRKTGAGNDSH